MEAEFLKYAHMSPMERMRDSILKSMGLSEDSLKSMSPEARKAVEDKIKELIKQQMEKQQQTKGVSLDKLA